MAVEGREFLVGYRRPLWAYSPKPLHPPFPILALQAGDDQGITAEDNAAFERALTDAGVEHEIVTYEGAISDDRLRDGLRVLAENIPGVKKVRDRLAWIEPNSGMIVPFSEETED